jgi:hypothetical protein
MNPENRTNLLKAFLPMMAEHQNDPDVVKILGVVCQDVELFAAPYSVNPKKTLTYPGSLALATMQGYKSIRAMEKVSKILYPNHEVSVDRLVLCLLLLMAGRHCPAPSGSASISTALHLSSQLKIRLSPEEIHAISQASDEFTIEWWIISQAIQAIEVENM